MSKHLRSRVPSLQPSRKAPVVAAFHCAANSVSDLVVKDSGGCPIFKSCPDIGPGVTGDGWNAAVADMAEGVVVREERSGEWDSAKCPEAPTRDAPRMGQPSSKTPRPPTPAGAVVPQPLSIVHWGSAHDTVPEAGRRLVTAALKRTTRGQVACGCRRARARPSRAGDSQKIASGAGRGGWEQGGGWRQRRTAAGSSVRRSSDDSRRSRR